MDGQARAGLRRTGLHLVGLPQRAAAGLAGGLNWSVAGVGLAVVTLVLLGWWTGQIRARNTDLELRQRLARRACEVADAVNPALARQLTFTPADADSPAYRQLCTQWRVAASNQNFTGIYSLGLRGGVLRFGPEGYLPGDPMASAPGTAYRQPPEACREVFRNGKPVTVGPFTDEFGTFVSAFAPVFVSCGDEVLMVVGIDVLASDWQARLRADRRGPLLVSLGVALLLVGGALRLRSRREDREVTRIRPWIVMPVAVAMLAGLAVFALHESWAFHDQCQRDMRRITATARGQWQQIVATQLQLIDMQMEVCGRSASFRDAWEMMDDSSLAAWVARFHAELQLACGVSSFTLLRSDQTVLLRAHDPARRGDRRDHPTLQAVARTGEAVWGIEAGDQGQRLLLAVRPLAFDGVVHGYLEMGAEVDYLAGQLAKTLGVELLVATRACPCDPDAAVRVTRRTGGELPAEAVRWLEQPHAGRDSVVFLSRRAGSRLACGAVPLTDPLGHVVAHLVMLQDLTGQVKVARSLLFLKLAVMASILAGILGLLWWSAGVAERRLVAAFTRVRTSESRYQALFETMADGVMLVDPDGRIVRGNPAALRILGVERSALEGRHGHDIAWWMVRHEGSPVPADADQLISQAIGERRTITAIEMEVRRPDGAICWVETSVAPLQDAEGRLEGSVVTFADLTARKLAEDLIRLQRDLSVAVHAQDGLDAALQCLLESVCRIPGVDCGGVYRVDGLTGESNLLAHRGFGAAFVAEVAHVAPGTNWASRMLAGQPIYLDAGTIRASAVFGPLVAEGLQSATAIPQRHDGRIVASLNLGSHTLAAFAPQTRTAIESIAAFAVNILLRLEAREEVLASERNFRGLAESALDGILITSAAGRHLYANGRAAALLGYTLGELLAIRPQDLADPVEYAQLCSGTEARLAGTAGATTRTAILRCKDGRALPVEIAGTRVVWQNQVCDLAFIRDLSERQRMAREILRIGDWERARIGQNLHDTVGQQLAGIAYLCHALAAECRGPAPQPLTAPLEQLSQQAMQAVEQVRHVARGLAPVLPGRGGLPEALRRVAESVRNIYTIDCMVHCDGWNTEVDREAATHLFLLAQEAVTNAARHGGARHVAVRLTRTGGFGELVVTDDGAGLPAELPEDAGLGLHIMQYRAELVGGTLRVERNDGGGTCVACRFDLARTRVEP